MKISTKGRYAVRMLLDLSEHVNEGFISLKDIAKRQNISKKYLEQIISILNKPDIIISNRGFQGGYKLAKQPCEYTIGEILRLTEGSLATVACTEKQDLCERSQFCYTLPIWKGLNKVITSYLDNITLQDVLDKKIV